MLLPPALPLFLLWGMFVYSQGDFWGINAATSPLSPPFILFSSAFGQLAEAQTHLALPVPSPASPVTTPLVIMLSSGTSGASLPISVFCWKTIVIFFLRPSRLHRWQRTVFKIPSEGCRYSEVFMRWYFWKVYGNFVMYVVTWCWVTVYIYIYILEVSQHVLSGHFSFQCCHGQKMFVSGNRD